MYHHLTVNGNTTINSILHGIDISLSGTLSATTIAGNGISLSSNTARTSPDTRSIVNDIVNNTVNEIIENVVSKNNE